MSFILTDEQTMMRDSLVGYLAEHYSEPARKAIVQSEEGFSQKHWKSFAKDLGILGAALPEEFGGLGGGPIDNAVIMEAFGRFLVVEPYLWTVVVAGGLLGRSSSESASTLVRDVVSGDAIVAFAYAEPHARFNPSDLKTVARKTGDGFVLEGQKSVVIAAPFATHMIVTARTSGGQRDEQGVSLFLVDANAPGITRRDFSTIDDQRASQVTFAEVKLPPLALMGEVGQALPSIQATLDEATLAICAEAVGIMRKMMEVTVDYLKQRRQFGKALGDFQALQHRLADMLVWVEHADSVTRDSLGFLHAGDKERGRVVAAAKAYICEATRFVGQNAIQLHGGMGTTEDLAIGRYFKRAITIEKLFGSTDYQLARYEASPPSQPTARRNGHTAGELESALDYDAFRAEVRAFVDEKLTPERREQNSRQAGSFAEPGLGMWWHRTLYDKGWIAPAWPKHYGGTGWDPMQRHIFDSECATAGAPLFPVLGLQMCGPVLMKFGTQEQKDFFLPKILSGEHYWCQGYSEPQAGSDLAALRTSAVRDGDHYVGNGSKIWTTHAHFANWIFVLVRTSSEGKRQEGITFLLAPMSTPGISVQPIRSIWGEHEQNQVFFDNVRIPIANRVGAENQGWTIAKYLLEHERGGGSYGALVQGIVDEAKSLAQAYDGDSSDTLWQDPFFRRRITWLEIQARAQMASEARVSSALTAGGSVGAAMASILKLSGSELTQKASEIAMEALGYDALPDQRHSLSLHSNIPPIGPSYAAKPTARFLSYRAMTIAGGTSEILRNIVAKAGLDL